MEFQVLGPLQVIAGDRPVRLGGPMQRAVLAQLVLAANRVVSMAQLVDGLWGTDPPARAVGTVQGYVSNLRRALEPDRRPGEQARVLGSRAPGYVLQVVPERVDWLRFEELFDQARQRHAAGDLVAADALLVQARALWRGAPLADLAEIAVSERARLDGLRLQVVEEHMRVLLELGRHDEVVCELELLAAEHPLREDLRGLQMIALYCAGRQVDALAVYSQVRRRLADEHGLDPGVELRRMHELVLRQDPPLAPVRRAATYRPGAATHLVGRAEELAVLRDHLGAAQAGSGRVVLVEGEPGVGKTRLATEVATEATARGFLALWGGCVEAGSAPPLWPWLQVLRGAGEDRDLRGLAPGARHQTLADVLRELARARPLLLLIEDLQWADETSLAPLEFLAAHLTDARVLLVGTYREVDLPRAQRLIKTLGVLARLPDTGRVALRNLDVNQVADLIRGHTKAAVAVDAAAAVHRRTEGNPFFVTELLRSADPADLDHAPVPAKIRDVIRGRVARLSHPARTMLETAAMLGQDVDARAVGTLSGFDGDAGLTAAETALENGLLTTAPDRVGDYRFTHRLVQETLADDLSPIRRARLRQRMTSAHSDAHDRNTTQLGALSVNLS